MVQPPAGHAAAGSAVGGGGGGGRGLVAVGSSGSGWDVGSIGGSMVGMISGMDVAVSSAVAM